MRIVMPRKRFPSHVTEPILAQGMDPLHWQHESGVEVEEGGLAAGPRVAGTARSE